MSFFRRSGQVEEVSVDQGVQAPQPILGVDPCSQPGCTSQLGVPCSYVDRKGRACGTSWCPEHHLAVDERVFCRRHSGVVRAINSNSLELFEYPDMDNRAASLCEWVSNDLDPLLRALLAEFRSGGDNEQISALPMRLVIQRQPPARAWSRAWTLSDHTGVKRKVTVLVDEANDVLVVGSVDGSPVVRLVPPWISERIPGLDEVADDERRSEFRAAMIGPMVDQARKVPTY